MTIKGIHFLCVVESKSEAHFRKQIIILFFFGDYKYTRRSRWPRGLKRGSEAAHLLGLWVRIPLGVWMFVVCECCVLSGRILCVGMITRPEESYRVWRVPWVWWRSPVRGCSIEAPQEKENKYTRGKWSWEMCDSNVTLFMLVLRSSPHICVHYNHLKLETTWNYFLRRMFPHICTRISLFETSPACPSDKNGIAMKISMEYCGNGNWQIKTSVLGGGPLQFPICGRSVHPASHWKGPHPAVMRARSEPNHPNSGIANIRNEWFMSRTGTTASNVTQWSFKSN
jgi:hypothetical protein